METPKASTALEADRQAEIEREIASYLPWLRRRIALILGDAEEAQDLAQEAMVRALRQWPIGSAQDNSRWLAVVAIRLAVDELRRRRRWGFHSLRETDASWAMNSDPDLWKAISRLKPEVRASLLLTVLDGYTQEEVALAFGVKSSTVASWLSRSRDALQSAIGER